LPTPGNRHLETDFLFFNRRALSSPPIFGVPFQQAFAAALQYHQAGNLNEAEAMCRFVLTMEPANAEAMHLLGIIAHQTGRNEQAIAWIQRAIGVTPDNPAFHCNLGEVLRTTHRLEEAVSAYRRALAIAPATPEVHNNLGNALKTQGDLAGAAEAYRRAIQFRPDYAEAYANLGSTLSHLGQFSEAASACQRALEIWPGFAPAYNNLGVALAAEGRHAEAIEAFRGALRLMPSLASAHKNLGDALMETSAFAEADEAFRAALDLDPAYANARFSRSLLRLLLGDFEAGLPLYESRLEVYRQSQRGFSQPMWNGCQLERQRILVHAEQGFGDAIQFVRYASLIAERGGEVIVECPRELMTLLSGREGISKVVAYGENLPAFDLHVPMLSLPLLFRTTPESIPAGVPYLFADPDLSAEWARRLSAHSSKLRLGLAWASNPKNRQARKRDIRFSLLEPLLKIEGIDFFSLQIGEGGKQLQMLPKTAGVIDYTDDIQDFSDMAAFMSQLDLIISVDTAVPHLAGALGRPVWTLLAHVPDWRWGATGEKTPWYPTMRLFRQPAAGDWTSVIRQVTAELTATARAFERAPRIT
jgi:tetratricopeptide (TPR) repeat protein